MTGLPTHVCRSFPPLYSSAQLFPRSHSWFLIGQELSELLANRFRLSRLAHSILLEIIRLMP